MKNINKFNRLCYRLLTRFVYSQRMSCVGSGSIIFNPMRIDNPSTISIGSNVFIAAGAWLLGPTKQGGRGLIIKDRTVIGHHCHLVSLEGLEIGNSVLFADKVFVTDCMHEYADISIPILDQPVSGRGAVKIGDETMVGENACIMGASIGKHCVVGANSVVTHDVPDYSIVVGAPARIISRYSFESGVWEKLGEWKE